MQSQNRSFISLAFLSLLVFGIGCAQGNCRSQLNAPLPSGKPGDNNSSSLTSSTEKVKVYKYTGELQCGMGAKIDLAEMAKELKNIEIFQSEVKADNLMHIQQCGSPTGKGNVYTIKASDLSTAKSFGFREWLFE